MDEIVLLELSVLKDGSRVRKSKDIVSQIVWNSIFHTMNKEMGTRFCYPCFNFINREYILTRFSLSFR